MNKKLKRHTYTSRGEKVWDFLAGLLLWVIGGTLGCVAIFLIIQSLPMIFLNWIVAVFFISLFAYFAVTKYWVAVGLMTNILINLIWQWRFFGILATFEHGSWLMLPFPLYMILSLQM